MIAFDKNRDSNSSKKQPSRSPPIRKIVPKIGNTSEHINLSGKKKLSPPKHLPGEVETTRRLYEESLLKKKMMLLGNSPSPGNSRPQTSRN
mgnify:CR=1 FL=1